MAKIAVIVFDLPALSLPGSRFGVEIFFVLSGRLITSIIRREITFAQHAIARFYPRRVRRTMPALLMVKPAAGRVFADPTGPRPG